MHHEQPGVHADALSDLHAGADLDSGADVHLCAHLHVISNAAVIHAISHVHAAAMRDGDAYRYGEFYGDPHRDSHAYSHSDRLADTERFDSDLSCDLVLQLDADTVRDRYEHPIVHAIHHLDTRPERHGHGYPDNHLDRDSNHYYAVADRQCLCNLHAAGDAAARVWPGGLCPERMLGGRGKHD